jgi:hypothetical protein
MRVSPTHPRVLDAGSSSSRRARSSRRTRPAARSSTPSVTSSPASTPRSMPKSPTSAPGGRWRRGCPSRPARPPPKLGLCTRPRSGQTRSGVRRGLHRQGPFGELLRSLAVSRHVKGLEEPLERRHDGAPPNAASMPRATYVGLQRDGEDVIRKGRYAPPTRSNAPRVRHGRQTQIRAESTGLGGHPAGGHPARLDAAVSTARLTGHASACRSGPAVEHREHEQHQKTHGDGQGHKSEDPGSPTASTGRAVSRGSGGLVRLLCHAVLLRDATAPFPVRPDIPKRFDHRTRLRSTWQAGRRRSAAGRRHIRRRRARPRPLGQTRLSLSG